MEKKYYYDCPIQALYMQKEFGVQFYTSYKNDFSDKKLSFHVDIKDIYNVLIQLLGIYNLKLSDNKIYVAPESEHIFEPEIKPHPQKVDIIYRNNKHFFNPKEEN